MDYQELIDERYGSYQIQKTSRKKLDNNETENDMALSVFNFQGKWRKCSKVGHTAKDFANLDWANLNLKGNAINLNGRSRNSCTNNS